MLHFEMLIKNNWFHEKKILVTGGLGFIGRLNQGSTQIKLFSRPARPLKNLIGSRLK